MRRTILLSLALAACKGDPQTSYCEALCDWATSCSTAERGYYPGYDEASTRSSCLSSAEGADADCSSAKDGLDPASGKLLTECTDAIDAESTAGECDAFTGSIDDLKSGTTPTECAGQGADAQATFDAARGGAAETSAELCGRFSWTFCDKLETCLLESLGVGDVSEIPEELVTAAGGTPAELCEQKFASETASCESGDVYAPEEDLTDVNAMRQSARECLGDFAAVTCDDLMAGSISATCAAAVQDPTVFSSALLDVATAYTSAD